MHYDYLVVGAGLFGAAFAQRMLETEKSVLVIEKRDHIGGNVFTEEVEGIQVHRYGAHIFHTDSKKAWEYVNRFAEFNRYTNSPIANYHGQLYSLPFNMYTFHKMWDVNTPIEAADIIARQRHDSGILVPTNLEEQAISLGESITPVLVTYKNTSSASVIYLFQNEKRIKTGGLDKGFEFAIDRDNNQFTISGTPTEEGQYKIVMRCTATATYDGQGFSDTIRVNVNPPATGVVDLARQNGWVDMDGDFSKTLKLHFCVSEMQTADVQLFDMGGRLVYSDSFGVDGEMSVGISGLNDLPSGIYMLSVRGKEGTWTKKVRR